jgi:hypothetical protein
MFVILWKWLCPLSLISIYSNIRVWRWMSFHLSMTSFLF